MQTLTAAGTMRSDPPVSGSAVPLAEEMRAAAEGFVAALRLVDPARLDPVTRERIEAAAMAADRFLHLLAAACDLAAPADRLPALSPAPLDLSRFLRALSRQRAAEAEGAGLKLSVSLEPSAPETLLADQAAVGQILDALVVATLASGGSGQVTLRAGSDPDGAPWFEVEDSPASRPGDPVGFDALQRLARHMQGTIARRGGAGAGGGISRLTLPAAMVMADHDEPPRRPDPVPSVPAWAEPPRSPTLPRPAAAFADSHANVPALPDLQGMRILMAEDNATNQLVAGQMLQSLNAVVTIASDGAEAIEALDRGQFDLLLIDIEMPRVSGLDVIRHVRALPDARARLPLIALTAYAMREHREKIAELGADGLIPKPILGIAEFGTEILRHHRRAGAAPSPADFPAAAPAPAPASAVASAAAPAAASGDLVERGIYDALADTIGPEGMAELLAKVEEDLQNVADGIAQGVAIADYGLVRAKTHVLISVAGAIGAVGVQKLAGDLNALAHKGEAAAAEVAALGKKAASDIAALIGFVAGQRALG